LCLLILIWAAAQHAPAHAAPPAHATPPKTASAPDAPEWNELTPAQRQVLQPLAHSWGKMDDTRREKWISLANGYKNLSQADQQKMRDRMIQWSQLPAKQRGEARLRFQETRQLTPEERRQKWEAYQALSPEERKSLADQAKRKQDPVLLPDDVQGPREQAQQALNKRRAAARADGVKTNEVPTAVHGSATPTAVAPSVIKAGQGATTSLVNQRPQPPLHQQTGLPKINATSDFVDPVTLMPKKGAQGAGITPVSPSTPSSR